MAIRKKVKETNFIFMQKSKGEKAIHAVVFLIFFLYALTLLLPLIWLVLQSVFDPVRYNIIRVREGALTIPKEWHFENYTKVFDVLYYNETTFFGMIFNSLWYIFIAETWCMLWSLVVAYIFAKYSFKGRGPFYNLIIFTLIVPITGTTGAMYKLVSTLNLYDTGPLFVIATGVGGFGGNFLIYYGIFKSLSWSYAESVFIDGGGNKTAFFRVMLPQAMPAISAMMVSTMIGYWNEVTQFLMYLPSTPTVATGLYSVSIQNTIKKPLYFAGLVVSIIPVVILYSFMADKMMKNLSIGGLKG